MRSRGAIVLPPLVLLAACVAESVPSGEALYLRHCASCHGLAGRGDGPAAMALQTPPTDLTALPADVPELMRVIDGRTPVGAHGTSAMPVWGEVFEQVHLDHAHAQHSMLLQEQALAEYVTGLSTAE